MNAEEHHGRTKEWDGNNPLIPSVYRAQEQCDMQNSSSLCFPPHSFLVIKGTDIRLPDMHCLRVNHYSFACSNKVLILSSVGKEALW